MSEISFTTDNKQGAIPAGFPIYLDGNYIVLTGENNAGKSSLLQLLFKRCTSNTPVPFNQVCLILPDRMYVDVNTNTGRRLEDYNIDLANSISGNNRSYHAPNIPPMSSDLPKLLLHHTSFLKQANKLLDYFEYFNLPQFDLRGTQEVIFEEIQVIFQGSGLRCIFSILAALTDNNTKLLLIDEPEQSLEPRLQKILRDLLYETSKQKQIIVATHSHLFLNRRDVTSNYVVSKIETVFGLTPVTSEEELYEITFDLLGCSLEDLFFPNNFLIVEGSTDQVIVEKVMQIKNIDKSMIKVVSASGVSKVANILSSVYTSLVPLVLKDSPYKSKVVVLVDRPYKSTDPAYEKIEKALIDPDQQLFKLTATTLEDYLHEDLYVKSGLDKIDALKEIEKETDYEKIFQLKTKNARTIAAALTEDDLKYIPEIVSAVEKAHTISLPRPLIAVQ
jgi:predicted ATP-dependent endonuclease of OLD family